MSVRRLVVLAIVAWLPNLAISGPGHDHGDASPRPVGDGPQRLPDGSLFLPKAAQRQIGVRTVVTTEAAVPKSVELSARVVMDPNAGGKVQPTLAGRIEPGPRGLPSLGQRVARDEVLAIVRPTTGVLERANQSAVIAELRASKVLAEKRLARLQRLAGTVPRKEIDAAEGELQSISDRLAAVGTSLATNELLVAPLAGVVSAVNVVAGQVVEPRELLFEVIDPARLRVEAIAYDTALIDNIASASASSVAGLAFPVELVGAGRVLKEQALAIQFRTGRGAPMLAIGQPLKVLVQTREAIRGIPVSAAAIVRNPGNQDIVWVHTEPEAFVPRTVRFAPLDGARVSVQDGLKAGDRVVIDGASLVNQIR